MPWIEITITDEELRLNMLGFTAHTMFETYWRDKNDVQYNGAMKWHRKCLNYLESLQNNMEDLDNDINNSNDKTKEKAIKNEWNKTHLTLERICFDQMRCLHVKMDVLQKYDNRKNQNVASQNILLANEASILWSFIQKKYYNNPTKLKMYSTEFKQHCNPKVLLSVVD